MAHKLVGLDPELIRDTTSRYYWRTLLSQCSRGVQTKSRTETARVLVGMMAFMPEENEIMITLCN